MFGVGDCPVAARVAPRGEWSAFLLSWRASGNGEKRAALESPWAQEHFCVKLLLPGLPALRAPSFRFSSPQYGSVRTRAMKLTCARATPAVSSFSFPALKASLRAPIPSFLRFLRPVPFSAPSKVEARCVHLCPPSTVRRTGSIAEGSKGSDFISPVSPFEFPASLRYATLSLHPRNR